MLTGESMPVEKTSGDKVTGGTVNQHRELRDGSGARRQRNRARADRRDGRASATQPRADPRLADKVAGWFVPRVIAIAVLTFIVWVWLGPEPRFAYAIVNAVAVLIIACPCALGLATPMSSWLASAAARRPAC